MARDPWEEINVSIAKVDPKDLEEAMALFIETSGSDAADPKEAMRLLRAEYCGSTACPDRRSDNEGDFAAKIRQCCIYRILSKQTGTEMDMIDGEDPKKFFHVDCPFSRVMINFYD